MKLPEIKELKEKLKKAKPNLFSGYDKKNLKTIILPSLLAGLICGGICMGIVIAVQSMGTASDEAKPAAAETPSSHDKAPLSVTLSFVGDCTLGTDENFDYSTSLNSYYESNGADYFLQNVRPIFEADDLTVVNFEGTLTTSEERCENLYAFKGDPEYVSILSNSGVEAATVANNHSHDYGEEAFLETQKHLKDAGVTPFGYDTTAVVDVKGVKVGLVGIYELYDHLERTQQLKDNIAKVKADGAQLIAVVFHWGNERELIPDDNQITLGRMAIDEGADIVVGHHPHVIQPIEKYRGKYIVYSLANFCFGGNNAPSDMDTFIFQQTFTIRGDEVDLDTDVKAIPCSISSESGYNNYQPTPAKGEEAKRILNRIWAPYQK